MASPRGGDFERKRAIAHKAADAAKAIKLEDALNGMPVPLHPGAERYYKV